MSTTDSIPQSEVDVGVTVGWKKAAAVVLLLLAVTGWLFHVELTTLFLSWFDDGDYITKGPILWALALFFLLRDVSPHRVFEQQASLLDVLVAAASLLLLVLLDPHVPLLLPLIVLGLIRHVSVDRGCQPNGFILFSLLAFSLPYFPLLVPYLQAMAVFFVEGGLGAIGIPVLVQEHLIAIPRGQFYVAEACSGFRYLANNLILFFLYALFSRFNTRQFLLALGWAVILGLVINWLRIFIIVFVAHHWGLDVPFFVRDHGNLGWVIYAMMLIPFFLGFLRIERMRLDPPKRLQSMNREILPVSAPWLLLPVFAWALFR